MNWFQSLTPQGRTIVAVIGTAVSAVILWVVGKEVSKYIRRREDEKDPKVVVSNAKSDLEEEKQKGEVLSFPSSTYSGTANTIFQLLDGCETLDSEIQVIGNIIKTVKKPIDWFNLIEVFGTKELTDCGTFGQIHTTYDLISLLKDQLDTSGPYVINIDGYKTSGFAYESVNVLRTYLKTIGVAF